MPTVFDSLGSGSLTVDRFVPPASLAPGSFPLANDADGRRKRRCNCCCRPTPPKTMAITTTPMIVIIRVLV